MATLILVRHGQSEWNLQNKFTGWVDVDITELGKKEALEAGKKLKDYNFTHVFSSVLKRANRTMDIILEEINKTDLPIVKNQALNERHYGDLQGKDKAETAEKYGDEQVHIWRRSFDIAPPGGESLKDTCDRVIPYFNEHIVPLLKAGENVLVVAHGNSLRALIMHLEKLSPDEILKRELPTGAPRVYNLGNNLEVLQAEFI
jgi:2,3-bisphosphoglycerate-dependent phosphoglycerate mutase